MAPCDPSSPLPLGVVRDLLGIARALYRAELGRPDAHPDKLEALVAIGQDLRLALELGERSAPGTLGSRAARNRAERATDALGSIVADEVALAPVVAATAARLVGRKLH